MVKNYVTIRYASNTVMKTMYIFLLQSYMCPTYISTQTSISILPSDGINLKYALFEKMTEFYKKMSRYLFFDACNCAIFRLSTTYVTPYAHVCVYTYIHK